MNLKVRPEKDGLVAHDYKIHNGKSVIPGTETL